MTEAVDDSDDDNDCKIHRVNTGSYKGKKKKSIFSVSIIIFNKNLVLVFKI